MNRDLEVPLFVEWSIYHSKFLVNIFDSLSLSLGVLWKALCCPINSRRMENKVLFPPEAVFPPSRKLWDHVHHSWRAYTVYNLVYISAEKTFGSESCQSTLPPLSSPPVTTISWPVEIYVETFKDTSTLPGSRISDSITRDINISMHARTHSHMHACQHCVAGLGRVCLR